MPDMASKQALVKCDVAPVVRNGNVAKHIITSHISDTSR